MQSIDIFIQSEHSPDIRAGVAEPVQNLAGLLAKLEPPIVLQDGQFIFLEDLAAPLEPDAIVEELLPMCPNEQGMASALRLHISRCRLVEVSVRFNAEEAKRRFAPGATIARVHHWAARRAFNLSPRDAAEHVLQIRGTNARPDRDVHVGTLTDGKTCTVAFDLVPRKRVEG
jgi:hypothetical protein